MVLQNLEGLKSVLLVLKEGRRGGRELGWIDDSPRPQRGSNGMTVLSVHHLFHA